MTVAVVVARTQAIEAALSSNTPEPTRHEQLEVVCVLQTFEVLLHLEHTVHVM
jgi:hypothetical protein